jgi:hypothetical protein
MQLAFLMEKEYPPYAKWYGTAFSRLKCGKTLSPILTRVLHSASWEDRETHLCLAYCVLAEMHDDLGITDPLLAEVTRFFMRPFRVIWGDKFARAIAARISSPEIASIVQRRLIGSIDIFSDNTDLLEDASIRVALKSLYE